MEQRGTAKLECDRNAQRCCQRQLRPVNRGRRAAGIGEARRLIQRCTAGTKQEGHPQRLDDRQRAERTHGTPTEA